MTLNDIPKVKCQHIKRAKLNKYAHIHIQDLFSIFEKKKLLPSQKNTQTKQPATSSKAISHTFSIVNENITLKMAERVIFYNNQERLLRQQQLITRTMSRQWE